ncbi:unnamed protein product [Durusdinium trenchii]|uniref:Uncharacterized protein n=2 Tax=Durusdinium trenchii TaxID=1381693 RepID=A0ABP0KTM2_9DINO
MGNQACCGNGTVGEPESAALPPLSSKPDEEDAIVLSSKGVVEEGTADEAPPSAPSKKKFSRVLSSVSLQGIEVDENERVSTKMMDKLRSSTTTSVNSANSMRSKKSIVAMISQLFVPVKRPDFSGEWICTATWGLDDFLKNMGIPYVKRLAAAKAPWPSWEFQQEQDKFKFTNHTVMGPIPEVFVADGSPYPTVDAHKQTLTCVATWEDATLVIERCGPQGRFREERFIDADGKLQFKLLGLEEGHAVSWGRTFRRKDPT